MKDKDFYKKYEEFRKYNLPVRVWSDERDTFEYVYYNKDYYGIKYTSNEGFIINDSIVEALSGITLCGFYYPYNTGMIKSEGDKEVFVVGHSHAHDFDSVIYDLYQNPESFSLEEDDKKFYSEQQLSFIRRVQKYLLFIGLKDIKSSDIDSNRYRNELQEKYKNVMMHSYSNETIESFISGERDFVVFIPYDIKYYDNYKKFEKGENQELVLDKDDNFKLFIEYTEYERRKYKDIKEKYVNNELNDEDEVVVQYFKILEKF